MLFIIEGVDQTGKTTLAYALEAELRATGAIRHCAQLKQHPLDEYELPLDGYHPGLGQHVIYDRHLIGEDVYGPLYRGRSALDAETRWHIEAYLNARGAVLVHLTHSAEEIRRRHRAQREDYLKMDHIPRALAAFERVISTSTIIHKTKLVDPTLEDVEALIRLGQQAEQEAGPLVRFPTYVGPPKPRYLLLGERRGGTDPQKYAAAFVPHLATSGHYLISTFPLSAIHDTGLANACEEDVGTLWSTLGKPRVATLGVLAHKSTAEHDVPHGRVPHPQYMRRFHHKHRVDYGRVVMQAVMHQLDMSDWRPR